MPSFNKRLKTEIVTSLRHSPIGYKQIRCINDGEVIDEAENRIKQSSADSTAKVSAELSGPPEIPSTAEWLGPPEIPNTCCMSGCANCVWLDYAEEVVRYFDSRSEKVDLQVLLDEVERNIQDPMIKSFIKMELKFKYR